MSEDAHDLAVELDAYKYIVMSFDFGFFTQFTDLQTFATETEAERCAREVSEKTGCTSFVYKKIGSATNENNTNYERY
jgi:hypothetical protein